MNTIDIPIETQALAVREASAIGEALGVHEILAQVRLIQSVMREVMSDGEHYGTIPGCGDKKTLLQPGAQKLTMTFRLAPEYQVQETPLERGHKEYRVICTLKSIQSQTPVGQGVGCCSTMEGKYRFRGGSRKCPECGKETIIKGRAEYGGGWLCFLKKGGCGAKWADGAQEIEGQSVERAEHDNPADFFNTVLKMAKKRAFVDATITATAASDIFTQDIGDDEAQPEPTAPKEPPAPPQASRPAPAPKTPPSAPRSAAKPAPASREERIKGLESWLGDKKEWAVALLRNFTVDGSDANSALMPTEDLSGLNDSALDQIKADPKAFLALLNDFIKTNQTSDLAPVGSGASTPVSPSVGSAPQPPQPSADSTKWRHECPKCTSTSIATQGQTENEHNLSLARCELCGWQWKLSDGQQWEAHDWMRVIVPVPPKGVKGDAARAYKQNPDTFGQLIRTDNRRAYGFAKNFKAEPWQGRISPADQAFEKACRDAEAYFDSGEDKEIIP